MTNSIAIVLALLICLAIAANAVFGWQLHVFLGRELIDAIEWLAFWR